MSGPMDEAIEPTRRARLDELARLIADLVRHGPLRMMFICTHNSRRSLFSQVLARAAAREFGFDEVTTYSGGTEASAFHANALAALERAGFLIETVEGGANPVYEVRARASDAPLRCFSKTYDDPANPREGYLAIMTCGAADAACPILPGAAQRFPLLYDDPGAFDGTARETRAYDECRDRIGREMRYLFRRAAELRG